MEKVLLNLLFLIPIFAFASYGIYLKKKRKTGTFLEIGTNHKLIFAATTKPDIHRINIMPDKFIEGISNFGRVKYKFPDISYCHWINEQGKTIGTTVLIKEDISSQYEMYYSEFLRIIDKIIEISKEQDFEKALTKYFEKLSKNTSLVSLQFEDLLIQLNVQYEKITGI